IEWDFSGVNLPNDVPIWRFAFWRNRVFLALPRWKKRQINWPTLLEAPWHNDAEIINLKYPVKYFENYNQNINENSINCNNLMSITGLDVDLRGRLWILDAPRFTFCPAKILIYDLQKNKEISRSCLSQVPTSGLKTLVVDQVTSASGYRAFIGDPGDDSIIIYSLGNGRNKWWKLKLRHDKKIPRVYTTDMAISKKLSKIYLTGSASNGIFSIPLESARHNEPNSRFIQYVNVTYHGSKIGTSSGLCCDVNGGLHYFLVSQHASVRWDMKTTLKAEGHSVVLQNEQVPIIIDYKMDNQKNILGLINYRHPFINKSIYDIDYEWIPKTRIIKVWKHKRSLP
ncbi:uncharacterized protein LOC122850563, partial [Aphidius gifuensis]|uniref:uncharacterized protein LOC122850563 n=1 Tax=Aphidius gifuensis TaxID=684658 RepID=UPI001CDB85F1